MQPTIHNNLPLSDFVYGMDDSLDVFLRSRPSLGPNSSGHHLENVDFVIPLRLPNNFA